MSSEHAKVVATPWGFSFLSFFLFSFRTYSVAFFPFFFLLLLLVCTLCVLP